MTDPDPAPCTAAMMGCNILTLQLVVRGKVWSGQGCALAIVAPKNPEISPCMEEDGRLDGLGRGDVFYMKMPLFV